MMKNIIGKIGREEKGSITVEAAFVMPVVVFCIIAMIYLAFYLHDYSRLAGTLDLLMHKAGIAVKHEADLASGRVSYEDINDRGVFYVLMGDTKAEEERIEKYLAEELNKGLFICRIEKSDVKVSRLSAKINIRAGTEMKLPVFGGAIAKITNIELDKSYPVHKPAETIRICELILDTGSKIKGINRLKDMLDGFTKK
ncbi:MAG: pilus assembly protein [Clostridiales bacterium]|nr:pilus assembly protein [Clostridiales bacterium]